MASKRLKRLNKHMNEVNRLRRQAMQDAQKAARLAAKLGVSRVAVKTPDQITMEELDKMFGH